ncbi:MAG: DUF1819 family protein [Bacillaceae bacterium]|nr:DUF1819 family protein [Bacillaceae bacterium]
MSKELLYSTSLTGASFLLFELKQVLRLKEQGLSDKEVREKVFEENYFQYKVPNSAKRSLPSVLRRANTLDETLRKMVLEEPLEVGKMINLYAIMKTDRLFFEFMDEVIREKLQANDYLLEKKDMNTYFTYKSEQDEKVASWTEKTVDKLKQVFMKLLFETGIVKNKETGELSRLLIDERVKEHLFFIGEHDYVRAMGE